MKIQEILKGSEYDLTEFDSSIIDEIENRITEIQDDKGNKNYYINCLVRKKSIKLTPEECVRQMVIYKLNKVYGYSIASMELEKDIHFGREVKRADICIYDTNTNTPYIIIEVKRPKEKDGKEQLKSYTNATGAPLAVWTNGKITKYWNRKDPNYFEDMTDIPHFGISISNFLNKKVYYQYLLDNDVLYKQHKSLKGIILDMEDEVLANAGVDVFEEMFKLIFTKLFDEMESARKPTRTLVFRNYGDLDSTLKNNIQKLFDEAKNKWKGVFLNDAKITLSPSHTSICVSSLQDVKLFNSNLEVIDDAFEYLINKNSKGEKGQFFTPRYVIEMCVRMLNPKEDEKMIDTASGSCGFPMHSTMYVWKNICKRLGLPDDHLFTASEKPPECKDYVRDNVFAIDFDERAVRVARTLNIIAGDGQTNVMHLNTLDYERWDERVKDINWLRTYSDGWFRLEDLRDKSQDNGDEFNYRNYNFDVLMANPPFAGEIKETRILYKYDLSKNIAFDKINPKKVPANAVTVNAVPTYPQALEDGGQKFYYFPDGTCRKVKVKNGDAVERDVLFIERNLCFLKPGGRMAIVLPQGKFNNASEKYIREYIADKARILAVIGLHGNVFKPHTGTKTSVMLVQKWDDELCPRKKDYPIFFATMQEPSKDNSGDKIYYTKKNDDGTIEPFYDNNHHLVVKHDLYKVDDVDEKDCEALGISDGIAEAFVEFAKKEKLSFF